jgi:hypothetical protein
MLNVNLGCIEKKLYIPTNNLFVDSASTLHTVKVNKGKIYVEIIGVNRFRKRTQIMCMPEKNATELTVNKVLALLL